MKYNGEDVIEAGIKGFNKKTFSWNLIDVCNQKCSYCYEGYGHDATRPKSTFFKDIKQQNNYLDTLTILRLKTIGTFDVDIIGGEPTLHPHLFNILQELTENKNCNEISLITNLSKPLEYFKKVNDLKSSKLTLCPSLHFEYYSDKLIQKCIDINKFKNITIIPIIMVHDNIEYHNNIIKTLQIFKENDIKYTISFLSSVPYYDVNYNAEVVKEIEKFAHHDVLKFNFKTDGKGDVELNRYDIHLDKLLYFKGWRCKPQRYIIKPTGGIVNACTGKKMPFFGQPETVNCNLNSCNCSVQWFYEKKKII